MLVYEPLYRGVSLNLRGNKANRIQSYQTVLFTTLNQGFGIEQKVSDRSSNKKSIFFLFNINMPMMIIKLFS